MLDINSYKINRINFNKKNTKNPNFNDYNIIYGDKKVSFYIKKTINITPITCYKNKYNIIIKIDDESKQVIESIEEKYIVEMKINREDYIPIIKQNDKGSVIKLKVMNRYKKLEIDILDEEKDPITSDELEKNDKINCLIEISNFWNFNGKTGLIIYAKKIYKLY